MSIWDIVAKGRVDALEVAIRESKPYWLPRSTNATEIAGIPFKPFFDL